MAHRNTSPITDECMTTGIRTPNRVRLAEPNRSVDLQVRVGTGFLFGRGVIVICSAEQVVTNTASFAPTPTSISLKCLYYILEAYLHNAKLKA